MSFCSSALLVSTSPTWARRNSYRWLTSAYSSMALTFTLPRALILPRTSDTWRRSSAPLSNGTHSSCAAESVSSYSSQSFATVCSYSASFCSFCSVRRAISRPSASRSSVILRTRAVCWVMPPSFSMRRRTAPTLASSRFSISFRLPAMAARMVSICAARSAFWAVSVSMFAASCLARASLSSVRLSSWAMAARWLSISF